jgi:hypothetical protein
LHALELDLHILAELEVKRAERLVEKKDLRFVDKRSCDRNSLLLTARKAVNAAALKALEVDHCKHFLDLLADLLLGCLFYTQTERDIFKYIKVREERVPLEDRVYGTLVGRDFIYELTVKVNLSLVGSDESANDTKGRGLAATRGTEQSNELVLVNVEIDRAKNGLSVIRLRNTAQLYKLFVVHSAKFL